MPGTTTQRPAPAGMTRHGGAGSGSGELRLVAESRPVSFTPGRPGRLTFRIVDAGGATLRDFETEQARRMHLIVVRRDLRRFQHLHPTQDRSGAWSTPLTLPDAGVYHAFADFQIGGERHTLGVDLFAAGRFAPLALPPESDDGERRRLRRAVRGGARRRGPPRAALHGHASRRPGGRPAALPRRPRAPRHAARRRSRVRARPPAERRRRSPSRPTTSRPAATGSSSSSATPARSTRPPSPAR